MSTSRDLLKTTRLLERRQGRDNKRVDGLLHMARWAGRNRFVANPVQTGFEFTLQAVQHKHRCFCTYICFKRLETHDYPITSVYARGTRINAGIGNNEKGKHSGKAHES